MGRWGTARAPINTKLFSRTCIKGKTPKIEQWEKSGKFPGKMILFAKNTNENNTIVSGKIILIFPLQGQRR